MLPADSGLAARAIAGTFLPAHRRALHHQHLNNVLRALERIREEHETLQVIKESGRYSDGVPLRDSRLIGGMEGDFADHAWLSYRAVLEHAPLLLTRCRPDATPWPEDTAALTRLREALAFGQDARDEWNDLRQELHSIPRTLPAHEWSRSAGNSASPSCPRSRCGSPTAKRSSARPAPPYRVGRPRCPRPPRDSLPPAPRPCPPRAPRRRTADRSQKGFAPV